ncbi:carboxylesterase family protein [Gramella sp. AN32]|uniref:Carboxylic ester hydrolase n=1 Tax=Christiangramia antarctica TaxID=2058158 RepID=A0ABW5X846_9FLAO|nr:carboxylesterase family protein [Gramella sp. AN32]MCM4155570.1 carboxylesterase [Gramella sp. AN32]
MNKTKYYISLWIVCFFSLNFYAQESLIVETENGKIEGLIDQDQHLNIFLGVPFAKPPIEKLRWKAPQELEDWEGVKETKKFGPSAIQTNVFGDMVYRSDGISEDCLYLNIWAPTESNGEGLPVLVYFYGGGFVAGDGSEPRYDGASMARNGIIAITVNYRLNIFGFLAHPKLSKQAEYNASGNYGLLDQTAALKWVYENIENFGGDPEKITIAGESAGSISVSALMVSPLSKDLLAGAIGESGASIKPTLAPVPLHEAEKVGAEFVEKTGYSLEALRALSTEELFEVYNNSGRFGFPTVIDSYFLPKSLPEIFEKGEQAQIPLMLGWNSAESPSMAITQGSDYSKENYATKIMTLYPENYDEVLDLYAANNEDEVRMAATDLASDRFIAYGTWKWFDLHRKNSEEPVYRYLFSKVRPSANQNSEIVPDGAPHASEIEYFLGNLELVDEGYFTKEDYEVSKTIQQYVLNFVKTGNPNGEELLYWPSAKPDDEKPPVLIIDSEFEVKKSAKENRYRFLDNYYGNE